MRMVRTFLALALLAGCGGQQSGTAPTLPAGSLDVKRAVAEPIAVVAGAPVSADDLASHASRNRPADGRSHTKEERERLLDEVLTDEVLFQKAIQAGLYHDAKVRKILINLLLRQEVYEKVSNSDFGEEELRAYYDSHRDDFVVPEKVQVRRIVVKIGSDPAAAEARARDIYAKAKAAPTSFPALAMEHSEGPFKRRGGDVGFVPREGKPGVEPEVIARAFDLRPEEITEPFQVGDAWHILMLVNRRDRVERTFDQMRGSVLRMVKQDRFETLRKAYVEQARKEMPIEVFQAKVDAVDLERLPHAMGTPPRRPHTHGDEGEDGHDDGHDAGEDEKEP